MLTYDYFCAANNKTVTISHSIRDEIRTWGELCQRAKIALDDTSPEAPVERLLSGGTLALKRDGAWREPSRSSDVLGGADECIPQPACCGGGCGIDK